MEWKALLCGVGLGVAVSFGGCKPGGTGVGKSAPADSAAPAAKTAEAGSTSPTPASSPEGVSEKLPEAKNSATERVGNAARINQKAQVIVLGYHRFVNKVRHPDTEITPAAFEAQLQQLKDAGITVIPLQDLIAWQEGKKEIPASSAVITFDDGWKSQYTLAWPILQKFGVPFTLFIYTDYIKGQPKAGGESISWEQLAEMRDAGVDIQGHTVSHQDLRGKRARPNDYETWLRGELLDSKQLIEQQLGVKVECLALPYGFYNARVLEVAKDAGYKAVFTVYGQKITHTTPPALMGRYMIEADKPRVFTEAVRSIAESGDGTGAQVQSVSPKSLGTQPLDGATVSALRPLIKVNLATFGASDLAQAKMRISGLGVVKAAFDPKTRTLSYKPEQDLAEGGYTVIVTAPGKRGQIETRWSFLIVPAPPEKATKQTAQATDKAVEKKE